MTNLKFTFFGSSKFSVYCLEEMKSFGVIPIQIITTPDKPVGRGLKLEANPVKIWAEKNSITCFTPETIKNTNFVSELSVIKTDLFLVASYGKIIPKDILHLSKFGTLNIHPSLLPKYRGSSPLQSQILNNESNIGISIMLLDELMDHGPIIAQENIIIPNWPVKFERLEEIMAQSGAKLFIKILPDWLTEKIIPKEQNHDDATFTKKVEKIDGLINIENCDQYKNYLKFLAYSTWPGTFFFIEKDNKKIRILIKDAEFKDNSFLIKRVLPEGKKEMNYEDFLRGLNG